MHRTLEFYVPVGERRRVSYRDFVNLLIHSRSFVILSDLDEEGREVAWGFAVTSDRTHRAYVSVFSMDAIIDFVEALARDDVVLIRSLRDGRGDYVAVGSDRPMPPGELEMYLHRPPLQKATNRILTRIRADEQARRDGSPRPDLT